MTPDYKLISATIANLLSANGYDPRKPATIKITPQPTPTGQQTLFSIINEDDG